MQKLCEGKVQPWSGARRPSATGADGGVFIYLDYICIFSVTVIVASSAALSSLKNGSLSPCSRAGWRRVFFLLMFCIFIFLIEFLPRHGTRCQFKHAVDVDESAELEKCKGCTKPLSHPVCALQLCGKCCSEECKTHNPIPKAVLG